MHVQVSVLIRDLGGYRPYACFSSIFCWWARRLWCVCPIPSVMRGTHVTWRYRWWIRRWFPFLCWLLDSDIWRNDASWKTERAPLRTQRWSQAPTCGAKVERVCLLGLHGWRVWWCMVWQSVEASERWCARVAQCKTVNRSEWQKDEEVSNKKKKKRLVSDWQLYTLFMVSSIDRFSERVRVGPCLQFMRWLMIDSTRIRGAAGRRWKCRSAGAPSSPSPYTG